MTMFFLVLAAVVAWHIVINVIWYQNTRRDILEARKERLHAERIEAIRESMRNKR